MQRTAENLNKGFKVATDNLDKIAKTTEKVLEKVEQILEILNDSPQVIVVMAAAIIMLTASVINLLIGIQNMKMAKAIKDDNEENKNIIDILAPHNIHKLHLA